MPVDMRPVVTLPFSVQELETYPEAFQYSLYRLGDPVSVLSQTQFWVPPYRGVTPYGQILPSMRQLKVVQSQRAGTDDIAPWLPEGVQLCNAGGVHDAATAELAVGLILASLRGIPQFVRAQAEGRWRHLEESEALADKRVVVVGYGSIGRALGQRLAGFECDVIGVTRTGRDGTRAHAELPMLLPTADVVVMLTPLTADTHHLVDSDFLAAMKDGSLLVNMSRGPVVDTDALVKEARTGRVRAALDVTDPEPLPDGHPLWRLESVLISPHCGGGTSAMAPRIRRLLQEQLHSFAEGAPLRNLISISASA